MENFLVFFYVVNSELFGVPCSCILAPGTLPDKSKKNVEGKFESKFFPFNKILGILCEKCLQMTTIMNVLQRALNRFTHSRMMEAIARQLFHPAAQFRFDASSYLEL